MLGLCRLFMEKQTKERKKKRVAWTEVNDEKKPREKRKIREENK
jgi:hypothetical protein